MILFAMQMQELNTTKGFTTIVLKRPQSVNAFYALCAIKKPQKHDAVISVIPKNLLPPIIWIRGFHRVSRQFRYSKTFFF